MNTEHNDEEHAETLPEKLRRIRRQNAEASTLMPVMRAFDALAFYEEAARAVEERDAFEIVLRYVGGVEAHADGVVGFVDDPHTKALRAASRKARDEISNAERRRAEVSP